MHTVPCRVCTGTFQRVGAQSEGHRPPDCTGRLGTSAMTGLEKFSSASISLERIFSNANSKNNVHFYITFHLPVIRSVFRPVDSRVQSEDEDTAVTSNQKKKKG